MKTLLIVSIIFLTGCAGQQIPKNDYLSDLRLFDYGKLALKNTPELYYCYNREDWQVAGELQVMWYDKLKENEKNMPEFITSLRGKFIYTSKEGKHIIKRVGDKVEREYVSKYSINFPLDSLDYNKEQRCKEFATRIRQ